jgi:hypothetical protein
MQKFREWLVGSYNGIYRIILKPSMPSRQTVFLLVLVFILGLLWAYGISPISYYDGDPSQLEQSWQDEWVRLLADRYARVTASSAVGPDFQQSMITLLAAVDDPLGIIDRLQIGDPGFRALAEQAQPGKAAPARPSITGTLMPFVVGAVVIIVATVVIALLYRILIYPNLIEPIVKRLRGGTAASDEATQRTIDAMRAAREAEARARESAAPVDAQFGEPVTRKMSVFLMGRGQYDDSFEIEDANDMFLGECGAAIAETIGEGDPAKVAAVEIWLFDKEDFVRTLTGVFATPYALADPAISSKLTPKGQVIPLQPNAVLILETNTLRLQARVVEVSYGDATNSYIGKSTIEIAVWQKQGAAATQTPVTTPAAPLPQDFNFDPPPPLPATPASPAMPPSSLRGAQPSYQPPRQPPPPPPDDDPFGGTGDFTPIG